MADHTYLFISRKSSHYKYYKKVVAYIGPRAKLITIKKFALPRLKYWSRAGELDIYDLTKTHLQRKAIRHPSLNSNRILSNLCFSFYWFREKCRATYYFSVFEKQKASTLVVWNGMKQPNRTPYIVAKTLGMRTFLFENGLLPHTTTLDEQGVNANNSMPRNTSFYQNWDLRQSHTDLVELEKRAPKNKACKNDGDIELPADYIFVPFQVPNDTQIICHSPWISSMEMLFECVSVALDELRNRSGKDIKVVMKEHPSWPVNFSHLYQLNPNIDFANGMNTQDLIERSLAVATINSTVGIEALLLKKQVITLGESCFNITGLVTVCHDQALLNEAFVNCLKNPFDDELTKKYLCYLQNEYLLPWTWSKVDALSPEQYEAHFSAMLKRLDKAT